MNAALDLQKMAREPLDPELKAFLTTTRVLGGRFVKHPLVFGPADYPGHLNRQLYAKKDQLKKAEESRAWLSWLYLHERPWRIPQLISLVNKNLISREELRRVLLPMWMDTEFPHQFRVTPLTLFTRAGFLTDAPAVWDALPSTLTVYRGDSRHPKWTTLSWTLARGKAEWFARRWASIKKPGWVWIAQLEKSKALAYIEGRNEAEVVVSPSELKGIKKERPTSQEIR
jgi:hypothetical protein